MWLFNVKPKTQTKQTFNLNKMPQKTCAVFCSSKNGADETFAIQTKLLGATLAKNGYTIIYGGSNRGLMGAVADAAKAEGGKVIGIIPDYLDNYETRHESIDELIVVESMHIRKQLMFEKAELVFILPGGVGTLDELFECLTWNQLNLHNKKIIMVNINGFYTHLIAHFKKMDDEQLLYVPYNESLTIVEKVEDIIGYL